MDAVHLARGVTGRDVILKIEGSYHGHHDGDDDVHHNGAARLWRACR